MNLANRITLARIALVPVYLLLKALQTPGCDIAAAIVFALVALSDTLDGYIARSRNQVTNFGKFMDPIADKLLVLLSMVLLTSQGRVSVWPVLIILARELFVSGFRLVAADGGKVIAAGLLGKVKAVLQMLAVFLLTLNVPIFQEIILWMSVIVTVWSGWEYVAQSAHVLKEAKVK